VHHNHPRPVTPEKTEPIIIEEEKEEEKIDEGPYNSNLLPHSIK
jgi:hypothetical protein